MSKLDSIFEEIRVLGHDLGTKVKELIHQGNVRRIIIKDEQGNTFMEIPVTVAAVAAILAPIIAAVGAVAAMAAKFTVVVEKTAEESAPAEEPATEDAATEPTDGPAVVTPVTADSPQE